MLAARKNHLSSGRVLLLIAAVAMSGSTGSVVSCASDVPATVARHYGFAINKKTEIFVIASDERPRIVESLKKAGLKPVDVRSATGYSLDVRLGGNRRTQPCGSVRNVTYILSGPPGRMAIIKGRGATGTCEPNMYDDMSAKLASIATS
jgi:hypothetical protein